MFVGSLVRFAGGRFFSAVSISSSPLRVAVVGSGPAGFYSAQYLLKHYENAAVDMYEKYPVPFGLVRFGVAPDHPEVKNVIHSFTTTAKTPHFRFFGGVSVGLTVTVPELLSRYHAVILAYGAARDRLLNIPGEDGVGVYSARRLVGWYNGLPDDVSLAPDLSATSVVIVGQGNVAVDVARILLTPVEALEKTDITEHALERLRQSQVKDVYLVGRRGPAQVAFTIKEFRELTKLPNVNVILQERDVEDIKNNVPRFPRQRKRLMELMASTAGLPRLQDGKNCHIRFFASPKKIVRSDGQLHGMNFTLNTVQDPLDINSPATPTDEVLPLKCGMVVRSIGYEAVPCCPSLPFDPTRAVVPNTNGRVTSVDGLYCSGWIKRGPTGVILTTMNDAYETVETLMADARCGVLDMRPKKSDILDLLRSRRCDPVTFEEWEKVDAEEVRRGESRGKPREKIVDIAEAMSVAREITLDKNYGEAMGSVVA